MLVTQNRINKSSHKKMSAEAQCGVCEGQQEGIIVSVAVGFYMSTHGPEQHCTLFRWTCLHLALWARGAMTSPWESHNFRGAIRVFNVCLPFCPTCIKCLRMANWARRLNRIESGGCEGLTSGSEEIPDNIETTHLVLGERKTWLSTARRDCCFVRKDCLQPEIKWLGVTNS